MAPRLRGLRVEAACFTLVFLVYFLYLQLAGDDRFYHDAFVYCDLRNATRPR